MGSNPTPSVSEKNQKNSTSVFGNPEALFYWKHRVLKIKPVSTCFKLFHKKLICVWVVFGLCLGITVLFLKFMFQLSCSKGSDFDL